MDALHWLAATALMTSLFWLTYVLDRMVTLGIVGTFKTLEPEAELKQSPWALRAKRAHYNAIENLAVFATLVLVAAALDKAALPLVVMAAQAYFWARVVHFAALTLSIPVVRTLAYLTGFAAQLAVAWVIFSA